MSAPGLFLSLFNGWPVGVTFLVVLLIYLVSIAAGKQPPYGSLLIRLGIILPIIAVAIAGTMTIQLLETTQTTDPAVTTRAPATVESTTAVSTTTVGTRQSATTTTSRSSPTTTDSPDTRSWESLLPSNYTLTLFSAMVGLITVYEFIRSWE